MIFDKLIVALALSAGLLDVVSAQFENFGGNQGNGGNQNQGNGGNGGNNRNNQNNQNGGDTGTATTGNNAQAVLNPANIQSGSAQDGQGQVSGVASGQAPSAT